MGGADITAIAGTYNGFPIISLVDPSTCASSALCNSLSPPPDNILYYPDQPYLDLGGMAFTVQISSTETDLVNLFFLTTDYGGLACSTSCSDFSDGSFFEGSFTVILPTVTPILS